MLTVNVENGLERVGENALCDYVAAAVIYDNNGDTYPVKVGFSEWFISKYDEEKIKDNTDCVIRTDADGIYTVTPEYIFVSAGWTANGDRVEAETIDLRYNRNFNLEIPDELEIVV